MRDERARLWWGIALGGFSCSNRSQWPNKPSSVQVEIFGQTYSVRAGAEAGYVERLAAHVDDQMREISRSAGAVDSLRIAVLAALNIADESARLREGSTRSQGARGRPGREPQERCRGRLQVGNSCRGRWPWLAFASLAGKD